MNYYIVFGASSGRAIGHAEVDGLCHMIGDDREHSFEPDDLTLISDDDYCPECGQVGCPHGR